VEGEKDSNCLLDMGNSLDVHFQVTSVAKHFSRRIDFLAVLRI
jgi:hypothetical protein